MKIRIIICACFLVVICILQTSCNNNKKKEIKEYYDSGKLKKSGWVNDDNTPVDTMKYFTENGNVERMEVRNDSGFLHGVSRSFHENGKIFQEIPYVNNSVEGFIYTYDKNGQLSSKLYHLKARQIGDGFWYGENGAISQYGFNGFGANHRNYIKYDEQGKIAERIAPFMIMDSVSVYTPDKSEKEIYEVAVLLSNPPKSRTSVLIHYLAKDSTIMKSDSVSGKQYYTKKETFPGDLYTIKFFGKQYDSLTGKTLLQNNTRLMNE